MLPGRKNTNQRHRRRVATNLSRRGFDPQPWNYVRELRECPARAVAQLDSTRPRARCTNGNQCIIRQDKNGKLIRKQKTSAACEESVYDCPTYASLLDDCEAEVEDVSECAPLYDCAPFSSVCLVFDKESCLVNEDTSLTTKEECEAKNDEDSGFVGGTAQWCPEASV